MESRSLCHRAFVSFLLFACHVGACAADGPPVIFQQPKSKTTQYGQLVLLSVSAQGTEPFSYQWFRDGTALQDMTDQLLRFEYATPEDNGSYTVVVTNAAGSATSEPATVEVAPLPPPEIYAETPWYNLNVYEDELISLWGRTRGLEVTFQWYKDGVPLTGFNELELSIDHARPENAGNYQLIATNPAGSDASSIFPLVILPHEAPVIVTPPRSLTVQLGDREAFPVEVTGTSTPNHPLVLQWYHNGEPIPGATLSRLEFNVIHPEDAGTYFLRASNYAGVVETDPVEVAVTPRRLETSLMFMSKQYNEDRIEIGADLPRPSTLPPAYRPEVSNFPTIYQHDDIAHPVDVGHFEISIPRTSDYETGEYFAEIRGPAGAIVTEPILDFLVREKDRERTQLDDVPHILGTAQWDRIIYVLDEAELGIRRYDLATGQWLPTVKPESGVGHIQATAEGVFCEIEVSPQHHTLFLYSHDLTSRTQVLQYPVGVFSQAFWVTNDYVILQEGSDTETVFRLYDRHSGGQLVGPGFPQAAAGNSIVGLSGRPRAFLARGSWVFVQSYDSGSVAEQTLISVGGIQRSMRLLVSPDEKTVVSTAGSIVDSDTLQLVGTLGRPAVDAAFLPDGGLVLLNDSHLVRLNDRREEIASANLPEACDRVFVYNDKVYAFRDRTDVGDTIHVHEIALDAFTPQVDAVAVDASDLEYTPQDIVVVGDVVHLLSRKHRNIFRWSISERRYLPGWTLPGAPTFFDFWPAQDALAVGLADGRIYLVNVGTGERTFLGCVPGDVGQVAAAGEHLVAEGMDPNWNSDNHYFVFNAAGNITGEFWADSTIFETARGFFWSEAEKRLYGLWPRFGGGGPDTLRSVVLDTPGVFSIPAPVAGEGDRLSPTSCFAVSPDGTSALTGEGVIRALPSFAERARLDRCVDFGAWTGDDLVTLRAEFFTSELKRWIGPNFGSGPELDVPGYPLCLQALDDGNLLAITEANQRVLFHLIDADLKVVYSGSTPNPPQVVSGASEQSVAAGSVLTLRATDDTDPSVQVQWYHDGQAIVGANEATLALPVVQKFQSGSYSAVVSRNGETTNTTPTMLEVTAAPPTTGRLLNLSTRGLSLLDDNVLIPGFVITGTGSKRMLIRAVGPTLGDLGVAGELSNPRMTLKRREITGEYVDVAGNDDWGAADNAADIARVTEELGAFPLAPGSRDAALLLDLEPGTYTVVSEGVDASVGVAIVELYDTDPGDSTAHLVNISNRGYVGTGGDIMIPGIIIPNDGPKTLLIRVVGPRLEQFGISDFLPDPELEVFRGSTSLFRNDNWVDNPEADAVSLASQNAGAFPLWEGLPDAALLVTLSPGSYTVHARGVNGTTGIALVEIYLVP